MHYISKLAVPGAVICKPQVPIPETAPVFHFKGMVAPEIVDHVFGSGSIAVKKPKKSRTGNRSIIVLERNAICAVIGRDKPVSRRPGI